MFGELTRALAELSALFHVAGRLHLLGRGDVRLHLDLSSPASRVAMVLAAAQPHVLLTGAGAAPLLDGLMQR